MCDSVKVVAVFAFVMMTFINISAEARSSLPRVLLRDACEIYQREYVTPGRGSSADR